MDFSNQCGIVTLPLKCLGKILLIPIEGLDIIHLAIFKTVHTGQNHSPTRRANGVGDGCPVKHRSLLCQTVDVGCAIQSVAVSAHCLVGMVVTHDENYIRTLIDLHRFFGRTATSCD